MAPGCHFYRNPQNELESAGIIFGFPLPPCGGIVSCTLDVSEVTSTPVGPHIKKENKSTKYHVRDQDHNQTWIENNREKSHSGGRKRRHLEPNAQTVCRQLLLHRGELEVLLELYAATHRRA
ncbi:hypothetical protein CRENBAI_015771 [Crenichthys baileyi]|uniref:Uncharacterized protein n=1 Tax=Crenichthys baileyi TaxID=28760 RepID=A0AAV9S6P0_9TELE